jgi:hypothetical protein
MRSPEIRNILLGVKEQVVYKAPGAIPGAVVGGLTGSLMNNLPVYEAAPVSALTGFVAGLAGTTIIRYFQNRSAVPLSHNSNRR